ncbi:hypothetical protein AU476_18145 [Cupriavidus sp. UYMSc13B]|nr:hypothetical protein AU476_18145 [Cupriavidus sp. UYMSc13B]
MGSRYAFDYIEAARVVDTDAQKKVEPAINMISPMPAYFLAAHGIELTLKAYLRHSGVSARELIMKYGHGLLICNEAAKELGLAEHFNEAGSDSAALELLEELNQYQAIRYISTGVKTFPYWSIVEPLAVRLHQSVAPVVGCHTFEGITYSAHFDPSAHGRDEL